MLSEQEQKRVMLSEQKQKASATRPIASQQASDMTENQLCIVWAD